MATLTQEQINEKLARMNEIQLKLKEHFDYKHIKCTGIMLKQFIVDHPEIEMPYDVKKMIDEADAMRIEYDKLKAELLPLFPTLDNSKSDDKLNE